MWRVYFPGKSNISHDYEWCGAWFWLFVISITGTSVLKLPHVGQSFYRWCVKHLGDTKAGPWGQVTFVPTRVELGWGQAEMPPTPLKTWFPNWFEVTVFYFHKDTEFFVMAAENKTETNCQGSSTIPVMNKTNLLSTVMEMERKCEKKAHCILKLSVKGKKTGKCGNVGNAFRNKDLTLWLPHIANAACCCEESSSLHIPGTSSRP